MIHPVILCGGSGTRLWPASRKAYPKQFAPLLGTQSLFQMTLGRFVDPMFAAPLVVTGDAFRFLAIDQAHAAGLADPRVVVEPQGRDTAAAVLMLARDDHPEALMLVAPSDHVIADTDAFLAAVRVAAARLRLVGPGGVGCAVADGGTRRRRGGDRGHGHGGRLPRHLPAVRKRRTAARRAGARRDE